LWFVVYGAFSNLPKLDASIYRSNGPPAEMQLFHYSRENHEDVLMRFRQGFLWDEFKKRNAQLAEQVGQSTECLLLKGEIDDSPSLNYLRDAVGLVTFLLDHGGIAVYDPLMFHWWESAEWHDRIFKPAGPVPGHHVVILTSPESAPGLTWFHTRGMRKFGRPELSVHHVPPKYHEAVIDLLSRFIELQGLGGAIEEGQLIRMKSLPGGMACHHGGNLDDPDFNNVHVEISWQHERQ